MKVDLSCPIELWEYTLPTSDNPACSFTFFNLDERPISSIQITVTCYNEHDDVLSRRVGRPMALDAKGRKPFSVSLSTEGLEVGSVDLLIDKTWYEDGHEWRRAQEERLVGYEPNELPPNRKLEQLRYIAGPDAVGYPSDQRNIWVCVCGRVNAAEERYCRRCEREKAEVFEFYSFDAVQVAIDLREQELEERARMAREEASRQEFIRQERARRKKRSRRVRTAIVCVTLALVAAVYLFIVLGLPELHYQTAMRSLSTGDYAAAKTAFAELVDYRDASQKIQDCDYFIATEYVLSRDEALVDSAIGILQDLGAYPGAAAFMDEAQYQKGMLRMEKSDFAAASTIFRGISGYRDSEDLRKQSDYQIAARLMASGDYEAAAEHFGALGNYIDAAVQAKECVYRPANALMLEGKYDEAAEMFGKIIGYSDASEQYQQAVYMSALRAQNAGDYEFAAERFMMLGNYGDADTQMKHSIYLAAGVSRDSGNYEMARNLFMAIADYEDSAEQEKACVYLPAVALMTEGDYEAAAAMFERVPEYQDARNLYMKCLYNPAVSAMGAEDFETAIALLEQIPEYEDAAKLINEAKYKRAEQLEADGELESAIEAFTALGTYSDAQERLQGAEYARAERLFAVGEYETAAQAFEALGKYKDAATRVKQCAYEQALMLRDEDDLQAAYDALAAIEDYPAAASEAQEIAYTMGERQFENGNYEKAAQAFLLAGKLEDAAERRKESIYHQAIALGEEKAYQAAGELFDTIADYKDARALRDEAYDLWLSDLLENARAFYEAKLYDILLILFNDLDVNSLPSAYSELRTIYCETNYILARQYIANDEPLEALWYLLVIDGYKNSGTLLEKNIYKLPGTWETEDGHQFAFYLNGTCILDGEEYLYNMKDAYGILTGDEKDALKRTHSFSSFTTDTLTLTEDATGKRLRFKRIADPEWSAYPEEEEGELSEAEMDLQRELERMEAEAAMNFGRDGAADAEAENGGAEDAGAGDAEAEDAAGSGGAQ